MRQVPIWFPALVCVVTLHMFAAAASAQQPATVVVAPVERKPITLASRLVATVEPMVRSTLAAEQAAVLRERFFDEGQTVEQGALLAKLDDSLLQRRLDSATAALRSAQAELDQARLFEQNLGRERTRITSLFEQGVATEKEYFDAISEHDQSIAAVTVEDAQVAEQQAAVDELALQIEKSRIVAPFTGVVNRRYVEVGQWMSQGDPVAEVVQLDPLYVRTAVPEGVLARLQPGAAATFTVDALGGREFQGRVAEILPVADAESRTFPVRLRVENPEQLLRPGMFARASVVQEDDAMLVVPKDAIVRSGAGAGRTSVVLAVNGVARRVPVQLGAADETSQAVSGEGLNEGDLVITRGNEGLMDGAPIMIQNPPGGPGGPPAGAGRGQAGPPASAPTTREQ